eukprot:982329-Pyramimonas_sp.AAC.1
MDLEQIQAFVDDIADDADLAARGETKDSNETWAEWCRTASCGGARPLHRTTKVKVIPTPAVAIGLQSGDPV